MLQLIIINLGYSHIALWASLEPKVDIVDAALRVATRYCSHYSTDFRVPLDKCRHHQPKHVSVDEFVFTYVMENLDMATLEMVIDTRNPEMLNGQADQIWRIKHYVDDTISHLPGRYDECIAEEIETTKRDSPLQPSSVTWKDKWVVLEIRWSRCAVFFYT